MKTTNALLRSFSVFRGAYVHLWQVRVLFWVGLAIVLCLASSMFVFNEQRTDFAFSKQQCTKGFILLPKQQKAQSTTMGAIVYGRTIAVGGFPLIARNACYDFKSAPAENKSIVIRHSLFGIGALTKQSVFKVGEYPKLRTAQLSGTISTAKPIKFDLTTSDNFFKYSLETGNSVASCETSKSVVTCQVKELKLEHSKEYKLSLEQSFNNAPVNTVADITAVTANPVTLTSESIVSGSTIYDNPSQIVISADRQLSSTEDIKMTAKGGSAAESPVAITSKIDGQKIIVAWEQSLPRQADISLTVGGAYAPDGGTLLAPFTATYRTSGGPKVTNINIRDRSVAPNTKIVLTLDQELLAGQNLQALFSVRAGGVSLPAQVAANGRTITITPNTPLVACTAFQVIVADTVVNPSGISGGSAWQFNSRVSCANVFNIGTSAQGRSIVAYKFGTGAKTILFTGNLHGNETNTKRLLYLWINELEGNPDAIPAGKSIVIVPLTNPDGFAAGSRTNANGVDLNRNFPANNWKSTVKMPSGETLATGGGVAALSEPEAQVLANYVSSLGPALVMSYHSMGNVVVANDAGNSWNLTRTYSAKSGYGAQNGATIGNFFDYDTTGAFEDWLYDKKGIAAILVELATRTNDEFSRNKSAMLQMVIDF